MYYNSKEDRLSFLSDAFYLGEKIPFYNKKMPENIEERKKETEFFPEKLNIMSRSPKWKMNKPLDLDKRHYEIREEMYNEKANKMKEIWENRKIKFIDDVSLSYFNLKDGHKGSFKYYIVI